MAANSKQMEPGTERTAHQHFSSWRTRQKIVRGRTKRSGRYVHEVTVTSEGTDRKLWEEEWTELEGLCTRWPWLLTSTCIAPLSHSPPPPKKTQFLLLFRSSQQTGRYLHPPPIPLPISGSSQQMGHYLPPPPPPCSSQQMKLSPPSHCQPVAAASKQDNIGMIIAWVSFKHYASTEYLNNL